MTFQEIFPVLKGGNAIRRKSWSEEDYINSTNGVLEMKAILADDWEVPELEEECPTCGGKGKVKPSALITPQQDP